MVGGDGDDSYYVNDAGDVVVELADEGTDTVYATIDYALSANIEKVVVRGSAGLDVAGNDSDNVMTGGVGADTLSGGAGADRINGGGGADVLFGGGDNDVLTGGAGADIFVFTDVDQGRDTITDFQIGVDKIGIDRADFDLTSFDAGLFESNAGGLATDAGTRFVYSETTGRLFFDADGSGRADRDAPRRARTAGGRLHGRQPARLTRRRRVPTRVRLPRTAPSRPEAGGAEAPLTPLRSR
ncbi:calcium-binding protein [Methylopila sp. Yamaguchi]|uniref:calcium-binding protein n=1 Tax=Methylopila sp. Yamaguchi TaxID=1437817 RepID=UPI000CAB6BD9|nr:calcium-binding protein [Methylopila sp. Yamaguchi]GBD50631.1 hypothetical protein METY_3844 [Methylopila sp. Yamaguchi]